jgi:protein-S-isoprenylcysteine O-methyltransferase Ste14
MLASAARGFRSSGTTVDPLRPERASALVDSGPFALTRNPMYVGMAGLLVAHALLRGSVKALLPVGAFVAVIDRVQIPPEEAAMAANFGADYEAYRSRVPRWLRIS